MTVNGLAVMFERLNLYWPDQPLHRDPKLAREWSAMLEKVDDDAVFEALPILAQTLERRPSLAQIIQQAKAAMSSRPQPLALPEGRGRWSPYAQACWDLGMAAIDHRLPKSQLDSLTERHDRWFKANGSEMATAEMFEEVQALVEKATGESPKTENEMGLARGRDGRYSEAHKARYLANAAARAE